MIANFVFIAPRFDICNLLPISDNMQPLPSRVIAREKIR